MAVTLIRQYDLTSRPWGYETYAEFTDGKQVHQDTLSFPSKPTQEEIDKALAQRAGQLEAAFAPPVPQFSITHADGSVTEI